MELTQEERFLMMPCSPGGRPGLVNTLKEMRGQPVPDGAFRPKPSGSVLEKLPGMAGSKFERMDSYAGLEGLDVG